MKRFLSLNGLFCLCVIFAGLIARPAEAVIDKSPYDWNGPYAGVFVGDVMSSFHSEPGVPGPAGNDGAFTGGGDVGGNWQFRHAVVGGEVDVARLYNQSYHDGIKFHEDWMGTARARAGYDIHGFLPYITAGLAYTDAVTDIPGVGSNSKNEFGYVAGGGIDIAIYNGWFGRLEFLHVDVPTKYSTIGGDTAAAGSGNDILRIGANCSF